MTDSRLVRAEAIFDELIAAPAGDREALLATRCAGDDALETLVAQLLAHDDSGMHGFLDRPPLARDNPSPSMAAHIGHYEIIAEIGRGGAGVVYQARQKNPHRLVALKVIGTRFASRDMLRRFRQESEILGYLQHPGIAQIFEAGATDIRGPLDIPDVAPYFAMELVRGLPLTRYCEHEQCTLLQRLDLFRDVCAAVQYAHQKGVIHRDLKPSNILVTLIAGKPQVKVIDFGIAKALAPGLSERTQATELHQMMGTPQYMSPEQAEGSGDIDTRSDVYALGVLLYELLTGMAPFAAARPADLAAFRKMVREAQPRRPSERVSDEAQARALRGDLDWIVLKCLEKERSQRYETASALAIDIERHLQSRPISARPATAGYRIRRFVRRNRTGVAAVAAVVAALLVGLVGTSLGFVRARAEQRRTEEQRAIARQEADQATAVSEFMREVLTSVEPDNHGADVRVRDVLAMASANATQRFAAHPLLEAQVREMLGQVFERLSAWPESKVEFERALALLRTHCGRDDARALTAEFRVMGTMVNMQQISTAESALSELLPRLQAVLGPDHVTTLDARRCAALVQLYRGRPQEAERTLVELRAHPALVTDDVMQVRILRSLFAIHRVRPPIQDRAERVAFWQQLDSNCAEWVDRATRALGPDSTVTIMARVKLAEVAKERKRYRVAAQTCREVMTAHGQRLGECHWVLREAMMLLAESLIGLTETVEPAELYLRHIHCTQQSMPGSFGLLIACMDGLRYLDRGCLAVEGEAVTRDVLSQLSTYGGGHGHLTITAQLFLAGFVSMQGRHDEAEALFSELFAMDESVLEDRYCARLRVQYAIHLVRCGRHELAEQHLTDAAERVSDIRNGTWDEMPDDIIVGFIQLYEAWGKPAMAEKYKRLQAEVFAESAP